MPSVEDVQIDLDSETVTVTGNAERTVLVEKLNGLGYPEKGHNTAFKKAKSYVSCAIGKLN